MKNLNFVLLLAGLLLAIAGFIFMQKNTVLGSTLIGLGSAIGIFLILTAKNKKNQ